MMALLMGESVGWLSLAPRKNTNHGGFGLVFEIKKFGVCVFGSCLVLLVCLLIEFI